MNDPVHEILERLDGVRPTGSDQWQAKCPGHEDNKASLSVKRGDDGRALLNCFAGCGIKAICAALGISEATLFVNPSRARQNIVETYPYHDGRNALLYEAVRFEPKDFKQRRPDGRGGWIWSRGRRGCCIACLS